jgi:hypothetical protein
MAGENITPSTVDTPPPRQGAKPLFYAMIPHIQVLKPRSGELSDPEADQWFGRIRQIHRKVEASERNISAEVQVRSACAGFLEGKDRNYVE